MNSIKEKAIALLVTYKFAIKMTDTLVIWNRNTEKFAIMCYLTSLHLFNTYIKNELKKIVFKPKY